MVAFKLAIATCRVAPAPMQRALLIGINNYHAGTKADPKAWRDSIHNLQGAENDVDAMKSALINFFHWSPKTDGKGPLDTDDEIIELKSDQATLKGIRDVIQKQIVDKAQPGETILIYYSGHGSTVKNRKTTKIVYTPEKGGQPYGVSNTIVPSDTLSGAPDITDKELADDFDQILDKKAHVTAMFDSCYSGELARGALAAGKSKCAPSAVVERPNIDADRADPTEIPYQNGALIISGARYFEPASESAPDRSAKPGGAFTQALTKVLADSNGAISVKSLLQKTSANLQVNGYEQDPCYECSDAGRLAQNLVGTTVLTATDRSINTTSQPKSATDKVRLQGGLEIGLRVGTTLKTVAGDTVVAIDDAEVGSSTAVLKSGPESAFRTATEYKVVGQPLEHFTGLKLYIPRSTLSVDQLKSFAAQLQTKAISKALVFDPLDKAPTEEVLWRNDAWGMMKPDQSVAPFNQDSDAGSSDKVFVSYPYASDLPELTGFKGDKNLMIQEVASLEDHPDYVLTGTIQDGKLQYAWVAPGAGTPNTNLQLDAQARVVANDEQKGVRDGLLDVLPHATGWKDANDHTADALSSDADGLAILKNWMSLHSTDDSIFPYHLELFPAGSDTKVDESGTVWGYPTADERKPKESDKRYVLKLVPDPGVQPSSRQARYFYVMDISADYGGSLVFPADNRDEQWVSTENDATKTLNAPFRFVKPLGVERFILVSSTEKIDHDCFNFKGLEGARGGLLTGISALFAGAKALNKPSSEDDVVLQPSTWSIRVVQFKSVPAPDTKQ